MLYNYNSFVCFNSSAICHFDGKQVLHGINLDVGDRVIIESEYQGK